MPKTALKPDQKPQRRKFDHRGAGTIRPIPRLANAATPVKPQEPLGVSGFLPRAAANRLVLAAATARMYPEDSFERRRALEDAIVAVKDRWPEYFRKE